jgi:hypothetical protein
MPYNSKPGARKYGNNPMKPAAPTAFKMRSGNGPLQFKQMGASPANFGLMDALSLGSGSDKTKDIKAPEVKTIDTKEGQKNTNKVKPQKLDIVNKDPKTGKDVKVGETNTSSRPDGEGPVTKEPKPNETTEGKAEKKGLWSRYRDYVTNADGKGSYAKNQDSINELANVVGNTDKHSTGNFEKATASQQKEKDAKAKEIATADANKKDAINATQKAEMHASNLAVNAQNIERSKALQKQTEQGVKVAQENISDDNKIESTENTSKAVLTDGSGGGKNLNENA